MSRRIFPRYRIIFARFRTLAFQRSARSKRSLASSPFGAICPSAFLTSLSAAQVSNAQHKSQMKDLNMLTLKRFNINKSPIFVFTLSFAALLALPGCNVNVKKDSEGKEKKVDIETPMGALHVANDPDVRDVGLAVYPGARKKEKGDNDHDSNAHINISSSVFGLKVVAMEYVSDDPPAKLVDYYKDELKKYGSVLECHP